MNIVLLEPEIPQNTGNIARTCAATKSTLHLIEPLGFSLADKYVKRAGLDYWQYLQLFQYANFEEFLDKNGHPTIYMATTKAKKIYSDVEFQADDYIMFGKETAGIPEEILLEHTETAMRIPMYDQARSLNLANSVAIVLYEALRQQGFPGLLTEGQLHRYHW